jgi:hypothetical protein
MKRQEVNCLTGEIVEIDLTDDELTDYEKQIQDDKKAVSNAEAQAKSIAEAKAEAAEKLVALGIDPKALGL